MKKLFTHIIPILIFLSCEDKIDYTIESNQTIRLVVEGMITNEKRSHSVKLTLPVQNLNEVPQRVTGAFVAITDQENVFLLEEDPADPGIYLTSNDLQGVFGKVYTLYIRIAEYEFTGSSYMVPVGPLQPLNMQPCPENDNRYFVETLAKGDPFIMELNYDWSLYSDCPDGSCTASSMFYHLNSVDVNEIFKPEQELVCFPANTVIKRRKMSLNEEFQSYIRAVMNETNWRGGLFDVERGHIPTNMSAGAIGYFAAASVVMDSILFQP